MLFELDIIEALANDFLSLLVAPPTCAGGSDQKVDSVDRRTTKELSDRGEVAFDHESHTTFSLSDTSTV